MPDRNDLHRNVPLTNLSIAYRNPENAYICHLLFPSVDVVRDSDDFAVLDKSGLRRVESRRAPRTEAKLADWANSWDSYSCKSYALGNLIDDDERDNNNVPGNLDTRMVNNLTDRLWLDWDYRVAVQARNTAIWANSSPSAKWDAATGTTIFADVNDARSQCKVMKPNTAAMSQATFEALQTAPELLELYRYVTGGMLSAEQIKALFRVDRLLIDKAVINTSTQGQADVIDYVWSDDVWMGYVAGSAGIDVMSAGYSFRSQNFQTRKVREELKHSDHFEVSYKQDEKVVAADLGVLLTNTLG